MDRKNKAEAQKVIEKLFPEEKASDETSLGEKAPMNWGQVGRAMLGEHPDSE